MLAWFIPVPVNVLVLVWQVLQSSALGSGRWLAAPGVPTVPGGTLIVTPYHAIPALWQPLQVSADTAVCPVADSAGVVAILKPVPVIASLSAWQVVPQSADPIGMWLVAPEVPTVPGGCTGCPPVPGPVPANGPLPEPWQGRQVAAGDPAECTMIDLPTP